MIKISTSSNLNFNAVNSYYLKRAKEEHALMKGCSGDLLEELTQRSAFPFHEPEPYILKSLE